jgi:hypothetical protein
MIHRFLPSKKVAIFLLLLASFAVFFAIQNQKNEEGLDTNKPIEVVTAENLSSKDTDKDGVADWEEGLWGTNPTKKDSDGDGVNDKDAIEARKVLIQSGTQNNSTGVAPTETDAFARQFFSSITALSQSGNVTEENIRALAELAANNIAETKDIKKYQLSDLKLVNGTLSAKATYKNDLKNTGSGLALDKLGSELSLLALSINKPKSEQVEEQLFYISTLYDTLAKRTAVIAVPKEIAQAHLNLINAYYGLSVATAGLSKLYTDPIVSTQALALYKKQSDALVKASASISAYIGN